MTNKKMNGAIIPKPHQLNITQFEVPTIKDNEVLVKTAYCGICGSDLHAYDDGSDLYVPGVVVGHEFSGTITQVGSDISKKYKVGQHVAVNPCVGCGSCALCKAGKPNYCPKMSLVGCSHGTGGTGEYTAVTEPSLNLLPDNVPLDIGALVEPMAVALRAVKDAGVKAGDNCLVIGCGPIGNAVVRCLQLKGAKVIVAEPAALRREKALSLGVPAFDSIKEDAAKVIADFVGDSQGVDVTLDCAGTANGATLKMATAYTRRKGTVMSVALYSAPVPLNMDHILVKGLRLVSTLCYEPEDWTEIIDAIADGRLHLEDMITGKIPLDKLEEDGFKALVTQKDKHVKILVQHE